MEIVEIIQPSKKLDSNHLNFLHKEIQLFINRGVKLILIDFKDVTYIDRESIIILKLILESVSNCGAELYICSLNQQVKNTFQTNQLLNIFNLLNNRQEFENEVLASRV